MFRKDVRKYKSYDAVKRKFLTDNIYTANTHTFTYVATNLITHIIRIGGVQKHRH